MKKHFLFIFIFILMFNIVNAVQLTNNQILVDISEKPSFFNTFAITTSQKSIVFTRDLGTLINNQYQNFETTENFRTRAYNSCEYSKNQLGGNSYLISNAKYGTGQFANELIELTCIVYITTDDFVGPVSVYTDYKDIGESCVSYKECGSACENWGNDYSPRCMDGGNGRVCFCGTSTGIYTTVCGKNSDCPINEECVAGLCTTKNTQNTGNPIDETTGNEYYIDESTVNDVITQETGQGIQRCSDGTEQNECSSITPNLYCQNQFGTYKLVAFSSLCGCEEGLIPDSNGLSCCNEGVDCSGTCVSGTSKYVSCPNGDKRTVSKCITGRWLSVTSSCNTVTESNNSVLIYLIPLFIFIIGLFVMLRVNMFTGGLVVIISLIVLIIQVLKIGF